MKSINKLGKINSSFSLALDLVKDDIAIGRSNDLIGSFTKDSAILGVMMMLPCTALRIFGWSICQQRPSCCEIQMSRIVQRFLLKFRTFEKVGEGRGCVDDGSI